MIKPTTEEVCWTIQLMLTLDDDPDYIDPIYRMTHIVQEGQAEKHPKWVKEYRVYQNYFENANKAPSDPTKTQMNLQEMLFDE